jgi:hypothetical protein
MFPWRRPSPEVARTNIIREMVETERKYVRDLELLQVCIDRAAQHVLSYSGRIGP